MVVVSKCNIYRARRNFERSLSTATMIVVVRLVLLHLL